MKKILLTSMVSLFFSITFISAQDVTECLEVDSNPSIFSSSVCNKYYTVPDYYTLDNYEVNLLVEAFSYTGLSDKEYEIEAMVYSSSVPSFFISIDNSEISSGNTHNESVNEYLTESDFGTVTGDIDYHIYSSWAVDSNPPDFVYAEAYLEVNWIFILPNED